MQFVATDYDEVRPDVAEARKASLDAVKSANAPDAKSVVRELDETDHTDGMDLPGADLSNEELTVRVLPKQEDEFTCSRCFLVQHRSRLAATRGDQMYCRDCAA